MVLNQKIPERKNWSQNVYYNGSKPENSRKRNWSKSIHYNLVLNQKIPERKKLVTEHTL